MDAGRAAGRGPGYYFGVPGLILGVVNRYFILSLAFLFPRNWRELVSGNALDSWWCGVSPT